MTLASSKSHVFLLPFLSFPLLYHLFSPPLPLSHLRLFAVDRALRGGLAVINGAADGVDGGGLIVVGYIEGAMGRERKNR